MSTTGTGPSEILQLTTTHIREGQARIYSKKNKERVYI